MGDFRKHLELVKEKRAATYAAFKNKQSSVVGDLAIKTIEQAIEADAARQPLPQHLGEHALRFKYAQKLSEDIYQKMRKLWFTYGSLGYEGVNGEKAEKAIKLMDDILHFFSERWKI
jgi:hypothetical protein